jgi:hypothetical protein
LEGRPDTPTPTDRHRQGEQIMKKSRKLMLYRETLRQLASPDTLREAAGGGSTLLLCMPTREFTLCPVNTCSQ